ncbi:MAG: MerR family transcriptional regulator [Salinisphaeraceae bacterium]|nr:MerR family transcriptional regulator [Salinisphaeraceae bacterium]
MVTASRAVKAEIEETLPPIPEKRYFAIGEVSELCAVKPHVLRYWEQEFPQLKPVKRRGNRRYYQHQDVMTVRRIRDLLYRQGFTIGGARQRLRELPSEKEKTPETALGQLREIRDELNALIKLLDS